MKDRDTQLIWEAYTHNEGGLATAGHVGLDLVGLLPGFGEAADLANAAWHASKGEYLMAGLSMLSMIPVLGDIIGKGGKVSGYLAKAGKVGGAVSKGVVKAGPKISKAQKAIRANKETIDQVLDKATESEKIAQYIPKIKQAIDTFSGEGESGSQAVAPQAGGVSPIVQQQKQFAAQGGVSAAGTSL